MKKPDYILKMLVLTCLLCLTKLGWAQAPCSATINAYPGINGNVTFYANAASINTTVVNPFTWDFGNGTVITGTNLISSSNQYTANGTYVVTMTYTSTASSCTAMATQTVVVTTANGCNLVPNFGWSTNVNGVVNFVSYSQYTVSGVTYNWDFGDGSPNGSGATVTHSYATSGMSYPVSFTVNNNTSPACVFTTSNNVLVCGLAGSISSTINTNGSVTFSATTAGASTIVNYYWNFGDGSVANGAGTPASVQTHTYAINSNFPISLMMTSSSCTAIVSTTANVTNVVAPCNINANFYAYQGSNATVSFLNQTTGTAPGVTYLWNFGDNTTSTLTSPVHSYSANGSYVATLTANNNYSYSCSSVKVLNVFVSTFCNAVAGFNASVGANGAVSFSNTSTGLPGTPTYTWSLGDGNWSNVAAPSHTYANGVYSVVLWTSGYTGTVSTCTSSLMQVVTVTTCIADATFSMVPTGGPQIWNAYPLNPGNIAAASWDWGDNSSSSTLYTAHTYSAAGLYSICLSVTVSCGSSTTYCMPYSIYKVAGSSENLEVIQITVVDPATVGIKNRSAEVVHTSISPNPNNGAFNLKMNGLNAGVANVNIYNVVGKIVYQTEVQTNNGNLLKDIQLDHVANGVYFVKVLSGNDVYTQKLIISRQ